MSDTSDDEDFPDLSTLLDRNPSQLTAKAIGSIETACLFQKSTLEPSIKTTASTGAANLTTKTKSPTDDDLTRQDPSSLQGRGNRVCKTISTVLATPRRRGRRIIYDSEESTDEKEEVLEVPDSTDSLKKRTAGRKQYSCESLEKKSRRDQYRGRRRRIADQSDSEEDEDTETIAAAVIRLDPTTMSDSSEFSSDVRCDELGVKLTMLTLSSTPPSDSQRVDALYNTKPALYHDTSSTSEDSNSSYFTCDSSPPERTRACSTAIGAGNKDNRRTLGEGTTSSQIRTDVSGISKEQSSDTSSDTCSDADFEAELDQQAILTYSPPPPSTRKPKQLQDLSLPPSTPSRDRRKIPRSPFRESNVAFWDEQKNANWINAHTSSVTVSEMPLKGLKENISLCTTKTPKKSAFEMAEAKRKKQFTLDKESVAFSFLTMFIEKICPDLLTLLSSPISIVWSKTLTSTAGRANYSKSSKTARIELSTKVIDSEVRLKSTLSHEMCHILVWCIDGQFSNPHGKEFKRFGALVYQELGIKVETTHGYEISYKYQWTCTNNLCGKEYGRHSKSIDPTTSVCSTCHSRIVQTRPTPRAISTPAKPSSLTTVPDGSPRKNDGLAKYQTFLKQNIDRIKNENPGLKYAEIIKLVAAEFADSKKPDPLMSSLKDAELCSGIATIAL